MQAKMNLGFLAALPLALAWSCSGNPPAPAPVTPGPRLPPSASPLPPASAVAPKSDGMLGDRPVVFASKLLWRSSTSALQLLLSTAKRTCDQVNAAAPLESLPGPLDDNKAPEDIFFTIAPVIQDDGGIEWKVTEATWGVSQTKDMILGEAEVDQKSTSMTVRAELPGPKNRNLKVDSSFVATDCGRIPPGAAAVLPDVQSSLTLAIAGRPVEIRSAVITDWGGMKDVVKLSTGKVTCEGDGEADVVVMLGKSSMGRVVYLTGHKIGGLKGKNESAGPIALTVKIGTGKKGQVPVNIDGEVDLQGLKVVVKGKVMAERCGKK